MSLVVSTDDEWERLLERRPPSAEEIEREDADRKEEARLTTAGWPPELLKSLGDPYYYLIGTGGTVIYYESASLVGDDRFVSLRGDPDISSIVEFLHRRDFLIPPERGITIRVSAIDWIIDCHHLTYCLDSWKTKHGRM